MYVEIAASRGTYSNLSPSSFIAFRREDRADDISRLRPSPKVVRREGGSGGETAGAATTVICGSEGVSPFVYNQTRVSNATMCDRRRNSRGLFSTVIPTCLQSVYPDRQRLPRGEGSQVLCIDIDALCPGRPRGLSSDPL